MTRHRSTKVGVDAMRGMKKKMSQRERTLLSFIGLALMTAGAAMLIWSW